jgi:hypothetical protein
MEKSISRTSTLRLFADDSLLYRPVNTTDDGKRLQENLTELTKWAEKWQMTFHPAKCYILRVTGKNNPIITNYEMLRFLHVVNVDQEAEGSQNCSLRNARSYRLVTALLPINTDSLMLLS